MASILFHTIFAIILLGITDFAEACFSCTFPRCRMPDLEHISDEPTAYIEASLYTGSRTRCLNVKSAEILCVVYGNPSPNVTWYKITRDFLGLNRTVQLNENGSDIWYQRIPAASRLVFKSPSAEDTGIYKCVSTNKYGTAVSQETISFVDCTNEVTITVTTGKGESVVKKLVVTPPNTHTEPLVISVVPGSPVSLICKVPGFDGNKPKLSVDRKIGVRWKSAEKHYPRYGHGDTVPMFQFNVKRHFSCVWKDHGLDIDYEVPVVLVENFVAKRNDSQNSLI